MKILFLVHSTVISGAEKSLLSLIIALINRGYQCIVASPHPSLLRNMLPEKGLAFEKVDSLRNIERKFAPEYLIKVLFNFIEGIFKLAKIGLRYNINIIHANSIACGIYV